MHRRPHIWLSGTLNVPRLLSTALVFNIPLLLVTPLLIGSLIIPLDIDTAAPGHIDTHHVDFSFQSDAT